MAVRLEGHTVRRVEKVCKVGGAQVMYGRGQGTAVQTRTFRGALVDAMALYVEIIPQK